MNSFYLTPETSEVLPQLKFLQVLELESRFQAASFMISRNAASHRKERLRFMVQISQLFSTFNVGTLFPFFRTLVFSLIMWSWHPPNFSSAFFFFKNKIHYCIYAYLFKISPRLKESNAQQLKKLINAVCFHQHVSLTGPIYYKRLEDCLFIKKKKKNST